MEGARRAGWVVVPELVLAPSFARTTTRQPRRKKGPEEACNAEEQGGPEDAKVGFRRGTLLPTRLKTGGNLPYIEAMGDTGGPIPRVVLLARFMGMGTCDLDRVRSICGGGVL